MSNTFKGKRKPNAMRRNVKSQSDAQRTFTKGKAWEIRPHEQNFALPAPGKAVNLNDERWYIGERRELAEKYASIPWTAIAGDNIAQDGVNFYTVSATGTNVAHNVSTLGRRFYSVLVAGLIPALGNTSNVATRTDMPWMTAAEQRIAYMQSKVSGTLPFAASDLVCYWMAAADIFAEIAAAERALRVAKTWTPFTNISQPRVLCNALGWDYDSILGNNLTFEGKIQEIIDLANTLLLPKDLTFVERWHFLYSNVLRDSNLPTAKLYAYRKDGFYTFEEDLVDTGTACQFHFAPCALPIRATGELNRWTPDTWFSSMMQRISKLLPGRSTTVIDVMAKLLRAYDMATFFAYPKVNATPIECKFDPEALTAFSNMTLTGIVASNSSGDASTALNRTNFDLIQDVDNLTLHYRGILHGPGQFMYNTMLLKSWEDHPSVGSLLEMTRLAACIDGITSEGSVAPFMWTGSEMVSSLEVYNGDGTTEDTLNPRYSYYTQVAVLSDFNAMQEMLALQRFEYAPTLFFGTNSNVTENPIALGMAADIDNYAIMPAEILSRIHRFTVNVMWGVQTGFIG